jgi:hypothetical protein
MKLIIKLDVYVIIKKKLDEIFIHGFDYCT